MQKLWARVTVNVNVESGRRQDQEFVEVRCDQEDQDDEYAVYLACHLVVE